MYKVNICAKRGLFVSFFSEKVMKPKVIYLTSTQRYFSLYVLTVCKYVYSVLKTCLVYLNRVLKITIKKISYCRGFGVK